MDTNLNNITKMYDKLTYYDQYGGSLILFIIITIVVIIIVTYFHTMINVQPIIDDWPNQRCKPNIIPIAGLITHPEGVSASEYTSQNFTYCTQNILSGITGSAVQPVTFITSVLQSLANTIQTAIQSIRAMFDKIRTSMQAVSEEIMGRIMNMMSPLIQIIISFRDLIGKIQGTMTAGLFTLLGSYYALKSLMGAIAQFIIIILIALAVIVASLWIVPFTWGAAIANTVIFIAIAIPMSIILAFMVDTLKVSTSYKIPKIKCFDKNTMIKMNNGVHKKITEIQPGEILHNNNIVTAIIKVTTEGSKMYYLNNVLVSDSHIVKFNDKWIRVSQHPDAFKCRKYDEEFLYCLNTSQKIIEINNIIFTDWDEIYDNSLNTILKKTSLDKEFIHKYLDCGFAGHSRIPLKNKGDEYLHNIKINDILENGEKVYGFVEIHGSSLVKQFSYNLGENKFVEGFSEDFKYSKCELSNKHLNLYHLLTDRGTFKIENITIKDYNAAIDRLLEEK
jgi:hypothetical protein